MVILLTGTIGTNNFEGIVPVINININKFTPSLINFRYKKLINGTEYLYFNLKITLFY